MTDFAALLQQGNAWLLVPSASALGAFHDAVQDHQARAQAEKNQRYLAGRQVGTGQILMFDLTGGLIPGLASITALLRCFSIGLALARVASGRLA